MTCPVCESCKDLGWCVRLREAEAERDATREHLIEVETESLKHRNERDVALAQVAALRKALAEISNECMYPINGRIDRVRRITRAALDSPAPAQALLKYAEIGQLAIKRQALRCEYGSGSDIWKEADRAFHKALLLAALDSPGETP